MPAPRSAAEICRSSAMAEGSTGKMRSTMWRVARRNLGAALWVAAAGAIGCGNHADKSSSQASEANEQVFGSVHLPLVTPDQDRFRLRGAAFDISHLDQKILTLDSEQAPDALALDADLL